MHSVMCELCVACIESGKISCEHRMTQTTPSLNVGPSLMDGGVGVNGGVNGNMGNGENFDTNGNYDANGDGNFDGHANNVNSSKFAENSLIARSESLGIDR